MRTPMAATVLATLSCGVLSLVAASPSGTINTENSSQADAIARILDNPVGPAFLQAVAPDLWNELSSAHESEIACTIFAPDTPEWYIAQRMEKFHALSLSPERYQPHTSQWGTGESVTLYYSFPPDGISLSGWPGNENTNFMHARWTAAFGDEQTWKDLFAQVFDEWAYVTGNTYIEIEDDGGTWPTSLGPYSDSSQNPSFPSSLKRGDIRIVSSDDDGPGSTLAFNFYPSSGGDMHMDSSELTSTRYLNSTNDFRYFRNTAIHEHGHGLGLRHECPADSHSVMQPWIPLSVDGAQHDDRLGAFTKYNDRLDPNGTFTQASNLNAEGFGFGPAFFLEDMAIATNTDFDYYSFTVTLPTHIDIIVDPVGANYNSGPQNPNGSCSAGSPVNTESQIDLYFAIYDSSESLVDFGTLAPIGAPEVGFDIVLPNAGKYYILVGRYSGFAPQAYTLQLTLNDGAVPGDLSGDGLVSGPDLGILLSNWGSSGNGDLNSDGVVDGQDLGILLSNWSS